jgi:hypothetical protein
VFIIEVLPECYNTPYAKSLGTWWFFSVQNAKRDDILTFELPGMTNQKPLMNADHRPVYSTSLDGGWNRVRYGCSFTVRVIAVLQVRGPTC